MTAELTDTQERTTVAKMAAQHQRLQDEHGFERIVHYPDDSIQREFIDEDAQWCLGQRRAQHGFWRKTEQGWERFWPVLWREQRV